MSWWLQQHPSLEEQRMSDDEYDQDFVTEMTKKTDFGHGVTLNDWGTREYLDGAQMQFMVTIERQGTIGSCLAYFGEKEDAELFAKAKAEQVSAK